MGQFVFQDTPVIGAGFHDRQVSRQGVFGHAFLDKLIRFLYFFADGADGLDDEPKPIERFQVLGLVFQNAFEGRVRFLVAFALQKVFAVSLMILAVATLGKIFLQGV